MAPSGVITNVSRAEDDEISAKDHKQSVWRSIWENNQGALLILLSEVCGSSMDAIARFLQQGGAGFHTLQVCSSLPTPLMRRYVC